MSSITSLTAEVIPASLKRFLVVDNIASQAVVKTDYPLSMDRIHYGQLGIDFDLMNILPLVKVFRNLPLTKLTF